jgi:hypothetical protein
VGDGSGTGQLYVAVVPPPGSTASVLPMPAYIPTAPPPQIDGNAVSVHTRGASGTYTLFNGRWLSFLLHMPADYRVDCTISGTGSGWWQLMYASDQGVRPDDKVGVEFNLVGSPVHLVPPIFL